MSVEVACIIRDNNYLQVCMQYNEVYNKTSIHKRYLFVLTQDVVKISLPFWKKIVHTTSLSLQFCVDTYMYILHALKNNYAPF